jgi:hypothetical protein
MLKRDFPCMQGIPGGRSCQRLALRTPWGPGQPDFYDVTVQYFEADQGDMFRNLRFCKERRLEPQITIGLLTDAAGFPLMVEAFAGNRAETATVIPTLQRFLATHRLRDVTCYSRCRNGLRCQPIEAADPSFIRGARIPDVPPVITDWRTKNPGINIADEQVFTQALARRAH